MKTIKAFKFRSLNSFENVADIFINKRFYAAHYNELNDPMEGVIKYDDDVQKDAIDQVKSFYKNLRICAFSRCFDSLLLWAHYADGFKGICIEVEAISSVLGKVRYDKGFSVGRDILDVNKHLQIQALLVKNNAWRYEKEVRFITEFEYVCEPSVIIKSVMLGVRTPEAIKTILLKSIPADVSVWETEICDKNNKVIKARKLSVR